ncbi:MAG: FtsW/RodA/SpoVE family cell cycle protein, partial [Planctomycetaceae bacterium]
MVCSASMTARPTEFEQVYLGRQTLFLLIAIGCAVVAGLLPARFWINAAPWLFALTLLLLLITLIPGVGTSVNGARRWLRLGGWTLQPSELAKVVVPLVVCRVAVRCRENRDSSRRQIVLPLIPLILAALLILPAPDLGTTLFLGLSTAIALWVSGWPMRNFVIAILLTVPALGTLLVLKPYQLKRVEGFLSTWRDVDQAPYQIRQSLTTLGVGGVAGTGLGHGSQKL